MLLLGILWWSGSGASSKPSVASAPLGARAEPQPRAQPEALREAPAAPVATPLALDAPASRESELAALHAAQTLRLHVRHAHGPDASGARVYVFEFDERQSAAQGVLDDTGRWQHEPFAVPVDVFIAGVTPQPVAFRREGGAAQHKLVLPAGAVLEGRVLIGGKPPGQRLPLSLSAIDTQTDKLDRHQLIPEPLPLAIGVFESFWRASLLTRSDGRFVVSGFRPGKFISVTGPLGFARDDALSSPNNVELPMHDYVLALREPAYLTGRILDAHDVPVRTAAVAASMTVRGPKSSTFAAMSVNTAAQTLGGRVNHEGRFRLPLPAKGAPDERPAKLAEDAWRLQVSVSVSTPSGAWLKTELFEHDPSVELDLGDLRLSTARRYVVEVVDLAGRPIADAVLRSVDREASTHAAPFGALITGPNGRLSLSGDSWGRRSIELLAVGFERRVLSLPPEPPADVIRVRLTELDGSDAAFKR